MRHRDVVRRLTEDGPMTVARLCAELGVSSATVRRDLDALEAAGVISRVHGGAVLRPGGPVDADSAMPFAQVANASTDDKAAVARRGAALVADGDVVLLDIGTTAMMLARELRDRPITVITANLAVIDVLRDDTAVELIVLGGQLRRQYHSLVGSLTLESLRQVRATTAFLGASGVQPDGTVLDTTAVEVPVKRALLKAAGRSVLLADRAKFPGSGALRVCAIGEIDALVTNPGAAAGTLEQARLAGVDVLLA